MYSAMTTDTIDSLEHIVQILVENPADPRANDMIERLKKTAASVLRELQGVSDAGLRSSAHAVADGLLAAAEICGRLQDRRS